ncbi:MAG: hypothetical protein JW807_09135 [Spirochaetes bacterium]|nr:hypothetical protein [Spirochaetota bacterium]
MKIDTDKLSSFIKRTRNIILLLIIVISGLYLIKNESTRTAGYFVFFLSFAWLYSYVVRRRTIIKK